MKYQIAVIGGGPAGYTAAELLGNAGKSVVLFEKNNVGGVCLNEGCVPTKTLLYSAKVYDHALSASKYGVKASEVTFDLGKIITRKAKVVRKLTLGIKARLGAAKVDIVQGEAYIKDHRHICCGQEEYECDSMIVCTGSETFIPPICGLDEVDYWTHRDALNCKELPESVAIIGGGVIGMEFASFYNSLGVKVTVVEMMNEILSGIDVEMAMMLRTEYAKRGVNFVTGSKVEKVEKDDKGLVVHYTNAEGKGSVVSQKLLLSVGRRPVLEGFGLENLNLNLTDRGKIEVDEHMCSSAQGIYICGDLTGYSLLAHTAVREAEVAAHHILGIADKMSYKAVPGVVYTNPELASVGPTEEMLQKSGISYRTLKLPMAYSGRFVAENEGVNGVCKVLVGEDNLLLAVHMLGNPASELIVMAGMMIEDARKYTDFKKYIFPHPTVGEMFREL